MGLFSFAKGIGEKLFGDKEAKPDNDATLAAPNANTNEPSAQQVAEALVARVKRLGLPVENLNIRYDGNTDTASVSGTASSQADRERIILAIGNMDHVVSVDDNMTVNNPEPASSFYTVKAGDSLSKIAQNVYGNSGSYMKIFEANKPMLSDPDKIYPGQVLRIPQ